MRETENCTSMRHIVTTIGWFLLVFSVFSCDPAAARQVTDGLGRKLSVPDDPRRVVTLAPNVTEIDFVLGRQDRLVGVTRFSDYPPETADLPKVGSYIQLDLEKIIALQPDLCIAIRDGNPQTVASRLESIRIPVYAMDPRNMESILGTVEQIPCWATRASWVIFRALPWSRGGKFLSVTGLAGRSGGA